MLASAMRVPAFRAVAPRRLAVVPVAAPAVQRGSLVVMAAEAEKEKKKQKKMPSPVKRAELNEERRAYNRKIKSACATRVKKAIKLAESLLADLPKSESDLKELDVLIGEANKELDKARTKGVLHVNTGGRRKARMSRYRQKVLIKAGLYTPAPAQ